MSTIHPIVDQVTRRIRERSAESRAAYLEQVDAMAARPPGAQSMGCANVAHAFAGIPGGDRIRIVEEKAPNVAIVTAYNDVLSAHAPLARYPDILKDEARRLGATAQVAGGVPAMCDGVTQGAPGMELSLFSRDAIAMGTAIALSHDVFDAALMLGICDKIVPGLLIGALQFGHLPTVFVPGGPMPSGLSNSEKAKVREQAAVMRDQVNYHLDRARAAALAGALGTFTDVEPVVAALVRTFGKIFYDKDLTFETSVTPGLRFRGERQDFEEMIGNLVDNASKWATGRVSISAAPTNDHDYPHLLVAVEDDGPGLPEEDRAAVLKRGRRLDETKPGSGLGLSIVSDLAALYRGRLRLDAAALGGLRAVIEVPGDASPAAQA